jgi:hypothetical protein
VWQKRTPWTKEYWPVRRLQKQTGVIVEVLIICVNIVPFLRSFGQVTLPGPSPSAGHRSARRQSTTIISTFGDCFGMDITSRPYPWPVS